MVESNQDALAPVPAAAPKPRTRAEHIRWCQEHAIAEMDFYHEPSKAVISMMSDLRKHPETNGEALQSLCTMMLLGQQIRTRQDAINFIKGFN